MNAKFFVIICVSIVFRSNCFSQERQLRYIAGYPNYNLSPNVTNDDWNIVYTCAILKQQGDSLIEDKVLCDSMHMLYYLRYYPNQNLISILLAGKTEKYYNFHNGSYKLLTISAHNQDMIPISLPSKIDTLGETYNLFEPVFYTLNLDGQIKYGVYYNNFKIDDLKTNKKTNILYYTVNPRNGKLQKSTSASHQFVLTNGNAVGPYLDYNGDSLPLQSDTVMTLLRIPSELDIDSVYNTPLPPDLKLSKYGAFLVIDDPMVRVLYFYEHTKNPSALTLRIYDKKNASWSKLALSTSFDNKILMKNFDGWLAGAIKVKNTDHFWEESKKQPGQEGWSRRRTKYSPSIYEILEVHERSWYSEGILYIYNIATQAYIQWDTKQADSEILLVEDNKVYYRKYDEIYEVPIVKGKLLGKHRLVVKNKYVPAIHFMFKTRGK